MKLGVVSGLTASTDRNLVRCRMFHDRADKLSTAMDQSMAGAVSGRYPRIP